MSGKRDIFADSGSGVRVRLQLSVIGVTGLGDVKRGIAIPPKAMMDKYISMIFGELS